MVGFLQDAQATARKMFASITSNAVDITKTTVAAVGKMLSHQKGSDTPDLVKARGDTSGCQCTPITAAAAAVAAVAPVAVSQRLAEASTRNLDVQSQPPLLSLSREQRAAMPAEELLRGLTEAVDAIAAQSKKAQETANFLLGLSPEEKVSRANELLSCCDQLDGLVNKQLPCCCNILQEYKASAKPKVEDTVAALSGRMRCLQTRCVEDLANVTAKVRALKDENCGIFNAPAQQSDAKISSPGQEKPEKSAGSQHPRQHKAEHHAEEKTNSSDVKNKPGRCVSDEQKSTADKTAKSCASHEAQNEQHLPDTHTPLKPDKYTPRVSNKAGNSVPEVEDAKACCRGGSGKRAVVE